MATVSEITKKENGGYGFQAVPSGDFIDVQLIREENADVNVSASIGDLPPSPKFLDNPYLCNSVSLFRVKETKGKVVFIESMAPILSCKVMDEDGTVTEVALDNDLRILCESGEELLAEDGHSLCLEKG